MKKIRNIYIKKIKTKKPKQLKLYLFLCVAQLIFTPQTYISQKYYYMNFVKFRQIPSNSVKFCQILSNFTFFYIVNVNYK